MPTNSKPDPDSDERPLAVGKIQLDPVKYEVTVEGEPVELTLVQFTILQALARRPGWVHTSDQIAEKLSRQPGTAKAKCTPAALKNHMYLLRRRLGVAKAQIHTVRGMGYTLKPDMPKHS
ncbi:MAG: winged helix-turn-helix domain-containing protein [Planctomycetota bacterium]